MVNSRQAEQALRVVWVVLVICAVVVGAVGVATGQAQHPFLAGVLLMVGAAASLAYASQHAVNLMATAMGSGKRGQPAGATANSAATKVARVVLTCWKAMFVIVPLIIAAVALWQAVKALSQ